ncbi:carbohydrate sulfotransferase 3-like isoform X1 [Procambarus clarkii]|uniref:carbohydrate sulfotransferase 3-like isoform X1 n=1 Tax=Procambarus clarkii TaxID=6728 RepID=UPI003742F4F3
MALKVKIIKGFVVFVVMMMVFYLALTLLLTYSYIREKRMSVWEVVSALGGDGYDQEPTVVDKLAEEITTDKDPSPAGGAAGHLNTNNASTKLQKIEVPEMGPNFTPPVLVLLLSSMPRSGSTLLTEILSVANESVVFFEPLWPVEKRKCIEDEQCVAQYLADVFTCHYRPDFEKWLKTKILFLSYFNPNAKNCTKNEDRKSMESCISSLSLKGACLAAPIRIIKVIRARLSWMTNLLSDPLLNLKIIHLTRDPRGSLNSINRFKNWNKNPHDRCIGLQEDMNVYDKLHKQFPSKLIQIKYEDLSIHPHSIIGEILQFLYGDATLPDNMEDYISSHMSNQSVNNVMSTIKNSNKQYEAWRYKISEKVLNSIETEPTCLEPIKRMRYTLFGSTINAKNSSISLFLS